MARLPWIRIAVALAAGAGVPRLMAQPKPTATISGFIRDSAGHPLEGAEVWLVGGKKTVTGSDGAFRLDGLKGAIRTWLSARHIGHFPSQTSVAAEPGDERAVTIVLANRPYELPEFTVRAAEKEQRHRLIDFVWRSRGSGHFLTRNDIERSHVYQLGQLVMRFMPGKNPATMDEPGGWGGTSYGGSVPNLYLELAGFRDPSHWAFGTTDGEQGDYGNYGRSGSTVMPAPYFTYTLMPGSSFGGQRTSDCPPAVAVNGSSASPGLAVNDFKPDEIEALEIYGGRSAPSEYDAGGRNSCGLVIVWLKAFVRGGVVIPEN